MEDKELVKKVRKIAKEFPENDMKRALLLGITDRFIGVKVNSIPISVIQNKKKYWEQEHHIAGEHLVVQVLDEILDLKE